MDKIFLKNLKLKTKIGIFDWEKQIDQVINVNLEVGSDIKKAADTDNVKYSLDYKKLANRIKEFVKTNNYELIEALIENMAKTILVEFNVKYVTISISKIGAIRDSEEVGITITREK